MKERDQTRLAAAKVQGCEKVTLMLKYRALRNECNRCVRRDAQEATAKRVTEANDPAAIWREVNQITDPKTNDTIYLKVNGEDVKEPKKVADLFNDFFINKVKGIRDSIDTKLQEDPTARLAKKMEGFKHTFQLHGVSEKTVKKAIQGIKPKKSSGFDGVSQELLRQISPVVTIPLTLIINTSISSGVFPQAWKHSRTIPVHKKGDTSIISNYRRFHVCPPLPKSSKKSYLHS